MNSGEQLVNSFCETVPLNEYEFKWKISKGEQVKGKTQNFNLLCEIKPMTASTQKSYALDLTEHWLRVSIKIIDRNAGKDMRKTD